MKGVGRVTNRKFDGMALEIIAFPCKLILVWRVFVLLSIFRY